MQRYYIISSYIILQNVDENYYFDSDQLNI